MEEDFKKINMGPASPQIGLPEPVLAPRVDAAAVDANDDGDDDDDDDDDDDGRMTSLGSSSASTLSSVPLSLSVASSVVPPATTVASVQQKPVSETRCQCVQAMAEAIVQGTATRDDDASSAMTRDSDLESNAFYWSASPPVVQQEYSLALDKALEKKSPKLFQLLTEMIHIDDESVKIAIKELVTTPDKVSNILKRMHEGRARKPLIPPAPSAAATATATGAKDPSPSFLAQQIHATPVGRDIQLVKKVAGKTGYFWRDGQLWTYPLATADMHHPHRDRMADVEFAKMQALLTLLAPYALEYHTSYTTLRKHLRDVVTSGDYQFPPPTLVKSEATESPRQPVFQAQTPAQWLRSHLTTGSPHFNVQAFLKDSKLGPLEHEPQYFVDMGKATAFLEALHEFVAPRDQAIARVGRNLLFDLQKTDDLLARFLEHHQSDMMLLVHKLSVLLAKESVLLRMWINYHLPNLAMWLSLIETLEQDGERCLVSPFFPSTSRKALFHRLTSLGVLDQDTTPLVQAYPHRDDDVSSSSSSEDALDDGDEDEHLYAHASSQERGEDLRFSKMFARLFAR